MRQHKPLDKHSAALICKHMFTPKSARRRKIVEFVKKYVEEHGFSPSFREIGRAVGIKSTKAVKYHLDVLTKEGVLRRTPGQARSLRSGIYPYSLPLVGRIAAGTPILAVENIEENISFDRFQGCFLLRVQGESMSGAGIMPGDMVIVRPNIEPQNGDIIVALMDEEATVKKFRRENGQIVLLPENPAFSPVIIQESPTTQFRIIGVVVGLLRNYK